MNREIIELQNKSVSEIVSLIDKQETITFKAPTGSGKTYMMADVMNRILAKDKDVVFIVSSLSKGDLAEQNYEKFEQYTRQQKFPNLIPYLISSKSSGENSLYIPDDYNVYVLPRNLYKEKGKLMEEGAFLKFIYQITGDLHKKIYVIRDECHIATNNLDELFPVDKKKRDKKNYEYKILNFSATPNSNDKKIVVDVELKESDAENCHLIKKVIYNDTHNNENNLEASLNQFEILKKQYLNLIGINPCIIIQLSNKGKYQDEIEMVKSQINKRNLKYMIILDESNGKCESNDEGMKKKYQYSRWKNYAKEDNSTIDVIVFKMAIAEGWDIPRACVLCQIRDTTSKQLDEQVIGRVRRNPCLLNFEKLSPETQALVSNAYVYGTTKKEEKTVTQVQLVGNEENNEVQQEIKLKITRLKKSEEVRTFDVEKCFKKKATPSNIFNLYHKYESVSEDVKEVCDDYAKDISKWVNFVDNIETVSKKMKETFSEYEDTMELVVDENQIPVEVSFPLISYYTDNGNYKNISNWIWKRTDGKEQFSFDSEAEKEWIDILLDIAQDENVSKERIGKRVSIKELQDEEIDDVKKYLIGKNYLPNSDIKFEYYADGIRSSYPDFIMKDSKNRIHIFETKSINKSASMNINSDEYENKIEELKRCYKYASKLTGYYFYIPIKENDEWKIFCMYNGKKDVVGLDKFKKFMKGKIDFT